MPEVREAELFMCLRTTQPGHKALKWGVQYLEHRNPSSQKRTATGLIRISTQWTKRYRQIVENALNKPIPGRTRTG